MTHDDTPEYGTPPEPKYGRRAEPDWTPEQIAALRNALVEPTREPFGIVLASTFLAIGAALSLVVYVHGGWWWLLAGPIAFFFLFGAVGLAHDIPKVPRDGNGRHLPKL